MMNFHVEHYKGIFHMALLFIVMLKMHFIDKKLSLLEKRFVNK